MTGKPGRLRTVPTGRPTPRPGNIPLPEPYLLGIAASVWLSRRHPRVLPGSRLTHCLASCPLIVTGTLVIVRSLQAAFVLSRARALPAAHLSRWPVRR
jgi:hypothetical protein